ncbi:sugar ABC transporter substrate-binding protein [Kribbella antibiotica]|uniref:Sugar ABC transporter substrate-binding protein n=1 Tax=Kribbella antibiotica TaxID=190195 RepID=A0A4R4ZPA1_9ACTN|nr:sugar ABC transporter substrate-binding protein [Kribbella antibiotica]TDD58722.1 sugar ABC transporter substrate-binding protein [Kribbella antibiotica]
MSRGISRRSFVGLTAAAAGAVTVGACSSGKPTADTRLRVAAVNHVWTRALQKRLPEFEERIGRRVSMSLLTGDQLSSSYNVKLNASATDIDVMMVRPLQEQLLFAHNNWLADLSDRAQDAEFNWSDFQAAPKEASTTAGKVLTVPVVTERPVLYYRKDLVPTPPRTLDELQQAAARLTTKGRFGYVGRGQRSGAVTQWSSFLYSYGGDFTREGQSAIATPEAIAAYQYYGDLLGKSGPPGATNMSLEQAMPIFAQGKAAFYVDADAIYTGLIDPKVSAVGETIGYAPFPAGPAGSKPYNIPSWSLGINRFSLLQDHAWEFIRWAAGSETVTALQTAGIPGARESVWANPAANSGFPKELAQAMQVNARNGVGHDRPEVLQVGRARDIVGRPLVSAILQQDVAAVARDADKGFAEFLVRDNRHRES